MMGERGGNNSADWPLFLADPYGGGGLWGEIFPIYSADRCAAGMAFNRSAKLEQGSARKALFFKFPYMFLHVLDNF